MPQVNAEFFIFHHDSQKYKSVVGNVADPRVSPTNLCELPLPTSLRVPDLTEQENRALFSEYLGLINMKSRRNMVGAFVYTIPLKFSLEWARETGNKQVFLPELCFETLLSIDYKDSFCYAVELGSPQRGFPEVIEEVHRRFRVGSNQIYPFGPYKGSLVVDRRSFVRFQAWLRVVIQYLLSNTMWREHQTPSRFSRSEFANKNGNEIFVGRYRQGLGGMIERCVAYYFAQTYGDRNVRIGDLLGNFDDGELLAVLRSVVTDNLVVLTFCDKNYLKVLKNWITGMRKSGVEQFFVVSLDLETHSFCRDHGVATYFYHFEGTLQGLWRLRVLFFKKLVSMGINFIHSDADAVWMRNPIPYLSDLKGNLVVSQGTIQPPSAYQEWGFVLCCGFFFSRASVSSQLMFDCILEDMEKMEGDQISLNRVILFDNVEWRLSSVYTLWHDERPLKCSRNPIFGESDNFGITILPHHLFQRLPVRGEAPYVVHPLSPKDEKMKLKTFKSCGALLLD